MATDSVFPESYKDPQYAMLDAGTEQKLGLPSGLLSSVRTNGERSNHSQTNSENTFSVYQFTPATRKAILDKYGLDVALSPQNASEGAGLLLQEGLKRNGNDPAQAVGEYIGGTNRANWGKTTAAYIQRVTAALGQQQDAAQPQDATGGVQLPAMSGPSSFDRAQAMQQQTQAPSQLAAVFQAYQAGQMSPEESQQYESDVRAGKMMLPRGASLKDGQPGTGGSVAGAGAQPLPPTVLQAYQGGQMTPKEMGDLEHDVRSGVWQLPQGVTADSLFGPANQPKGTLDRLADTVTGNLRRTPTTDALPDWAGMPELNQLSMASAKTGLGTLLSDPHETVQVIQSNFPGVQVRQDQKGNFILRSSVDGKEYAIKPGFQVSDIPRAIAGAAAFTPAGRAETLLGAGVKSAATQAAIEGTQAATGGTFNPGEVAGAGVLGAVVPGAARVIDLAAQPAKALVSRALGRGAPNALGAEVQQMARPSPASADVHAAVTPGGASEAGAPSRPIASAPVAPVEAAAPVQSATEVAQTAMKAGQGSKSATEQLATSAAPDAETVAAAERLGIQDHLQPDHVTTNDGFRQVLGVVKSNPTGALAQQEKAGLTKVAERANGLIDEIGGTTDLSHLNDSVKSRMQAAHAEISAREDALYQKIRDTIPATTEAPAPSALAFVEQRAKDLGGEKNLSSMEKTILAKLSPQGGADAGMLDALGPAAKQQAIEQGAGAVKQPTYALLDDVRRDVGAAARMRGPFSDADTGLAKKYYGLLTQDQNAVAHGAGLGDVADAARAATVVRKGMEDDLSSLFGKSLDHSMVTQLGGAMKAAAGGDAAKILAVLKATPDAMKQEVVASGLASVFRNAATRGDMNFTGYAKWFDNLQRNKQAYAAVMSNLPAPARAQLVDLARVSKGISDSLAARIKTGLRSSVLEEMKAPDTVAARLFELAKHAGKGLAADAVGGHGAGLAMAAVSAIKGNAKPQALKAIDELLTSPEFQHMAATAGTARQEQTVRAFAYSKAFTKFARAVGNPRELSNRERWVLLALQTRNAMN
jgi:hypothetical protein